MPRRNRVTPLGEIVADPERGTYFGNRGVLHDEGGRIRRPWQVRRWLICLLEFKGRHRAVMTPNRYTELFFLDEATGLAAGHRPCAECRRARFRAFRDAWAAGNHGTIGADPIRAATIDDRLHSERVGPDRSKRTFRAKLDELPDGVFVMLDDRGGGRLPDPWGQAARLVAGRLPGTTAKARRRGGHGPDATIDRPCDPGRLRARGPSLGLRSVKERTGLLPEESDSGRGKGTLACRTGSRTSSPGTSSTRSKG